MSPRTSQLTQNTIPCAHSVTASSGFDCYSLAKTTTFTIELSVLMRCCQWREHAKKFGSGANAFSNFSVVFSRCCFFSESLGDVSVCEYSSSKRVAFSCAFLAASFLHHCVWQIHVSLYRSSSHLILTKFFLELSLFYFPCNVADARSLLH